MRIGPEHWHCVSLDTAGVPHGGRYGRVEWVAQRMARHGLTLCWQSRDHRFGVASRRGGQWIWQCLLTKGFTPQGDPLYLNDEVLFLLLHWWGKYKTLAPEAVIAQMNYDRDAYRKRLVNERYAMLSDTRKDRISKTQLLTGRRGPKVFSAPKLIIPRRGARGAKVLN